MAFFFGVDRGVEGVFEKTAYIIDGRPKGQASGEVFGVQHPSIDEYLHDGRLAIQPLVPIEEVGGSGELHLFLCTCLIIYDAERAVDLVESVNVALEPDAAAVGEGEGRQDASLGTDIDEGGQTLVVTKDAEYIFFDHGGG